MKKLRLLVFYQIIPCIFTGQWKIKKLLAYKDEVICIKKVDNKNLITEIWTRSHSSEIFIIQTKMD